MTTHRITHRITHHTMIRITCDITHHITSLHHIISHRKEWYSTSHDIAGHHIIYRITVHNIPHYISIYTSICIIRHCLRPHFLQVHHHTALYVRSDLLYKYITTEQSTPLPCLTFFEKYVTILYVTALRQTFFNKCVTLLLSTSLPRITLFILEHHHTALNAPALGHTSFTRTPSIKPYVTSLRPISAASTSLYFTLLHWVTFLHQVHHNNSHHVTALGHTSFTIASPHYTLRHCSGSHFTASTSPQGYLYHCPEPHLFHEYITILYFTPLFWVTLYREVHHHTALCITVLYRTSSSTSPYGNLHHCAGSHYYKYIIIFYPASLSLVILRQLYHHTVFYVTDLVHTITSNSPYSKSQPCKPYRSVRNWPTPYFYYKYASILYSMSLPWVALLHQVHHHTALCVTSLDHTSSTSTSP